MKTVQHSWKYDKESNKITFNPPLKGAEVRVYFYRAADESKAADLPVCTAHDISGDNIDFVKGYTPFWIQIREKKYYIFKSSWIDCECE